MSAQANSENLDPFLTRFRKSERAALTTRQAADAAWSKVGQQSAVAGDVWG